MEDLKGFFIPRSIAIFGASSDLNSISGKPLRYLQEHGYKGNVYPINPKYQEVAGLKCYPDLVSLPETPDLLLVAVSYKRIFMVIEQCIEKGVKNIVVFSSGFAEVGGEGVELQRRVVELCREHGIRMLGPNCQGIVNLHDNVTAAFSGSLEINPFLAGGTGFVTQSGALGYSIFNLAQEAGVGFSSVVSTGNEADLNTLGFMEYMVEDDATKSIIAYLESVKDGGKFSRIADRALKLAKPLIVLKVGRSEIGQKASASHTGSLTGSDVVFDAFVKQKGLIRVEDIMDIIDLAGLVEKTKLPEGKGLGVVTTSGGAGILVADRASDLGLDICELPDKTRKAISECIPPYGSDINPVDVTAQVINDPDGFSKVLDEILSVPEIHGIVVVITMITGEAGEKMAQDIVKQTSKTDKPIVVAWTGGDHLMGKALNILREGKVPLFKSPIRATDALGALMKYQVFRKKYLMEQEADADYQIENFDGRY
jgi:acyl-CoA synthetase (NDP forming)